MSRERWDNSKSPDDDALVYAVRGEKWRGRKKSGTVSREVKGEEGGEGKGRKQARKQDHGEGCPRCKGFRLRTRGFKLFRGTKSCSVNFLRTSSFMNSFASMNP